MNSAAPTTFASGFWSVVGAPDYVFCNDGVMTVEAEMIPSGNHYSASVTVSVVG